MTRNKSYLSDYKEIDGGFVAFGGNSKGGKITGKGKIRTGKLDFEDVYFVVESKVYLFSVSHNVWTKKKNVLFSCPTECVVLSQDSKLTNESHVKLEWRQYLAKITHHCYIMASRSYIPPSVQRGFTLMLDSNLEGRGKEGCRKLRNKDMQQEEIQNNKDISQIAELLVFYQEGDSSFDRSADKAMQDESPPLQEQEKDMVEWCIVVGNFSMGWLHWVLNSRSRGMIMIEMDSVKGDSLRVQVYVDDIFLDPTKKEFCMSLRKSDATKSSTTEFYGHTSTPMETSLPLMKDENSEDR
ncbi:hypothetical protein Tco_1386427 [Tanacetum coccineum]